MTTEELKELRKFGESPYDSDNETILDVVKADSTEERVKAVRQYLEMVDNPNWIGVNELEGYEHVSARYLYHKIKEKIFDVSTDKFVTKLTTPIGSSVFYDKQELKKLKNIQGEKNEK